MAEGPATQPPLRPARWTVERFRSVDSTNRWLLDAARAGATEGLVAVADHQDAGRGRRGRTWQSAPGESLLVSVLLRPGLAVDRVHVLTMAASLALAEAVERVAGLQAALKWPNDLVVGDRKLAGLLAEADVTAGAVRALVIGAGCNLAQRELPADIADLATSCAIEVGRAPDRDEVLDTFLDRLGGHLDALADVVGTYRERLSTLGRDVRVELEAGTLEGRAVDLDDDGRLVVEIPGRGPVVVSAGDVVHLRPR